MYEVEIEGEFHSSDCSTMVSWLEIWSAQDLSPLPPEACLLVSELGVDSLLHPLQ